MLVSRVSSVALVLLVSLARCSFGDTPVETKEAIEIMKALAGKWRNVQWKSTFVGGRLKSIDDPSVVIAQTNKQTASTLYEYADHRAKIESSTTMPWIDGRAQAVSKVEGFAFDGKIYRRWSAQRPGTDPPEVKNSIVDGTISENSAQEEAPAGGSQFDHQLFLAGLRWMPPFFGTFRAIQPMPLWQFLTDNVRAGKEVSVIDKGDAVWEINTFDDEFRVRILYDTRRGGVVTAAEWGSDKEIEKVWRRLDIVLQESGDLWAPRVANLVYTLDRPPTIERVEFYDVRTNQDLSESAFLIEFPLGTRLIDYITKKAYTVTGGALSDQDATREFLKLTQFSSRILRLSRPRLDHARSGSYSRSS